MRYKGTTECLGVALKLYKSTRFRNINFVDPVLYLFRLNDYMLALLIKFVIWLWCKRHSHLVREFVPFSDLSTWWITDFVPVILCSSSASRTTQLKPSDHLFNIAKWWLVAGGMMPVKKEEGLMRTLTSFLVTRSQSSSINSNEIFSRLAPVPCK